MMCEKIMVVFENSIEHIPLYRYSYFIVSLFV